MRYLTARAEFVGFQQRSGHWFKLSHVFYILKLNSYPYV